MSRKWAAFGQHDTVVNAAVDVCFSAGAAIPPSVAPVCNEFLSCRSDVSLFERQLVGQRTGTSDPKRSMRRVSATRSMCFVLPAVVDARASELALLRRVTNHAGLRGALWYMRLFGHDFYLALASKLQCNRP